MSVLVAERMRASASRVLDAWLLRTAEQRVRGYEPAQAALVRRLWDAAATRRLAARELADPRLAPAAIALARDAAMLYGAARRAADDARSASAELRTESAWAWVDDALAHGRLSTPPAGFDQARALLAASDPLAADGASRETLDDAREALEATLAWLAGEVEPRGVDELRRARALRIALACVVVAVAAWGAATWALRAPNLALGKPATASSRYPGSGPPEGVTNGEVEPTYAASTVKEKDPWIAVDLLESVRVSRVVVHPRGDGFLEDVLPAVLEVSNDGTQWTEVARRAETFSQSSPWAVPLGGRRARWVRVRTGGFGQVTLTEIEVRGRR